MRNVLIIIFSALSFVIYSCSDSTRAQNVAVNSEVPKKEEVGNFNSRIEDLQAKLSTIESVLKKQQNLIDEQKKEIKELKENKSEVRLIWIIIVFVVTLLIAFMVIFYIEKTQINKTLKEHRNKIDQISSIRKYESKINSSREHTAPTSKSPKEEYSIDNDRAKPIEEKVYIPTSELTKVEAESPIHIEKTKEGYFGMLIGIDNCYFNELMTSKNDNALFKAWVNETEGEFTVFSLDVIRSIDGIENAVYKEGTPIKDAQSFSVIQKGKVKKNLKGNWSIVSPTKIKLN